MSVSELGAEAFHEFIRQCMSSSEGACTIGMTEYHYQDRQEFRKPTKPFISILQIEWNIHELVVLYAGEVSHKVRYAHPEPCAVS